MKQAVIIFTRVPIAGQTKTRLMPFLTEEECAALHRELIRNVYAACQETNADILVSYTPEDKGGILKKLLDDAVCFLPQSSGTLGERMSHAFTESFQKGYEKLLLIGTDIPEITAEILCEAFQKLEENDVVINPTEDGGYYLIGFKEPREDIWDIPHYGTNTVLQDTLREFEKTGLTAAVGKVLRDIDTKEDLMAWYGADRCIHCGACTKSCLFLEKYHIDLAGLAEHKELSYSCFLCGRCKAVCPKDIDGARIAVQMRGLKTDRDSYKGILWEKNPYKFSNYRKGRKKSVLFPGCNFSAFYPKTTKRLERLMKKYDIGIIYDCCGKPVYELGMKEDVEHTLKKLEARLRGQGVEELVILCPNCYHFFKNRIEIPMVTIYKKLEELEEGRKLTKESIPIYYPCPDREGKEMYQDLLSYLDGEVKEAFEAVQCCGLGGCAGVREPELSRQMAEKAIEQGEKELYTYCASCISNFKRKGMTEAYHILPLILGIEENVPLGIQPFMNRVRRKIL